MGITIQQLSVFLENREGRLDEVLKALADHDINIVALSLADTSDYGMLRMIVSDPHKGRMVLKEAGIKTTIAPTPRVASKCCGISLLVREEDLDTIQKCIDENQIEILKIAAIERDINPKRDKYC